MSFNRNRFTRCTEAYNSGKITLQNATPDNGPAYYTYASSTDTIETMLVNNYFLDLVFDVYPNDLFLCVASNRSAILEVVSVNQDTKFISTQEIISGTYQDGVVSLTGTQNQVLVNGTYGTPVDGDITLTLPQSIATTSSPTFAGLTLTNPLTVANGGTGLSTLSQGDLLYGSASNTLSALAKNSSSTRYLSNTGTSNNPAWAQVSLTTGVSGTLPVTSGGTGLSSTTANQLLYSSSTNTIAGLSTSNSSVLVTNGSGVPSLSTTLPAALTIPYPTITGTNGTTAATFADQAASTDYFEIQSGTANGAAIRIRSSNVNSSFSIVAKGAGGVVIGSDATTVPFALSTGSYTASFNLSNLTGNVTLYAPNASGTIALEGSSGLVPAGTVIDFAGTSAPSGYLWCDGSAVSRATYSALFSAIGTTWGSGDGSTTFNIPDFRRKTSIGSGGSGSAIIGNAVGNTGGEEAHTMTTAELVAHTHGIAVPLTPGSIAVPAGSGFGASTTGSTGSSTPFNVMQPSNVVFKCIKT